MFLFMTLEILQVDIYTLLSPTYRLCNYFLAVQPTLVSSKIGFISYR